MATFGTRHAHATASAHLRDNTMVEVNDISKDDSTVVVIRIGADVGLFVRDQATLDNIISACTATSVILASHGINK